LESASNAVQVQVSPAPPTGFFGQLLAQTNVKGIVFAYDEAQNLSDKAKDKQFPLALLLDVFQSIQRGANALAFMLVLTGLPMLFPKLIKARAYTERMFDVLALDRLPEDECRKAITIPLEKHNCPLRLSENAVKQIIELSSGYPYFIQFICKEVFDVWIERDSSGQAASVTVSDLVKKLDLRFYSGRWDNASDRQRDFMMVLAMIPSSGGEFTQQEIAHASEELLLDKRFSVASAAMMLKTLTDLGFVFRNRRGKYSFTVPMMGDFIVRRMGEAAKLPVPFGGPNAS
jgi:hypothetical protein